MIVLKRSMSKFVACTSSVKIALISDLCTPDSTCVASNHSSISRDGPFSFKANFDDRNRIYSLYCHIDVPRFISSPCHCPAKVLSVRLLTRSTQSAITGNCITSIAWCGLLPGKSLRTLTFGNFLIEKQYTGRFNSDFVEARRGDLERWLNRVIRHPLCRATEVAMFFLGCEDDSVRGSTHLSLIMHFSTAFYQ